MNRESSVRLVRTLKRRNAIEPIIGHLKGDCGMDRNYLKGRKEVEISTLMTSCAYKLKKILKHLNASIENLHPD